MRYLQFILFFLLSYSTSYASDIDRDSDNDGVIDQLDKCPNTAQLKKVLPDFIYASAVNPDRLKPGKQAHPVDKDGCELDSDGDGIVNSQDYCPQDSKLAISKGTADNGCPKHSDLDGTPDFRDKCPDTPRGIKVDQDGCPIKN